MNNSICVFKETDPIDYQFEQLIRTIRAEVACASDDYSGFSLSRAKNGIKQLQLLVKDNRSLNNEKYSMFIEEMFSRL